MKTVILALFLLALALLAGGWGVDRFGGVNARVNMDSLPLYLLGIAVGALDAALFIGYALYRLFSS